VQIAVPVALQQALSRIDAELTELGDADLPLQAMLARRRELEDTVGSPTLAGGAAPTAADTPTLAAPIEPVVSIPVTMWLRGAQPDRDLRRRLAGAVSTVGREQRTADSVMRLATALLEGTDE
jgi:hypothetical protein